MVTLRCSARLKMNPTLEWFLPRLLVWLTPIAIAPMVESAVRTALDSSHGARADCLKNLPPQHHPSFSTEDRAKMLTSEEAYLRLQTIALAGRPPQGPTQPGPAPKRGGRRP
jgi:hypothetical protein